MGDDEALAAKSSWLPVITGHCVCIIRAQRAPSVNRRLLFPGLVSLNSQPSLLSRPHGMFTCAAHEGATYLITNVKSEKNLQIYLAVFTQWPSTPPLLPGLGAANEERANEPKRICNQRSRIQVCKFSHLPLKIKLLSAPLTSSWHSQSRGAGSCYD